MAKTMKMTAEERVASERKMRADRAQTEKACSDKIERLRALRLARDAANQEATAAAAEAKRVTTVKAGNRAAAKLVDA